jgi:hypothetical protein
MLLFLANTFWYWTIQETANAPKKTDRITPAGFCIRIK